MYIVFFKEKGSLGESFVAIKSFDLLTDASQFVYDAHEPLDKPWILSYRYAGYEESEEYYEIPKTEQHREFHWYYKDSNDLTYDEYVKAYAKSIEMVNNEIGTEYYIKNDFLYRDKHSEIGADMHILYDEYRKNYSSYNAKEDKKNEASRKIAN